MFFPYIPRRTLKTGQDNYRTIRRHTGTNEYAIDVIIQM
ncbi:hypothetical protein FOXG_19093 [Fusarium oxysporum f. sp. lycopersici 4287]|uniref:Uncharacterized protein n=2 Tax=Fusarium oxysporum TaxID=5507 RepID=A0A0J9UU36_FUSO4|nr:hypothetical protein FOXG_19093 [Fusarium oxysporum f. sp. lycopersici 4287]EXK32614.1 hypothetical protein FOMG_11508 [Fusarium oxysporum f. sp. melonis 26406]KNB03049.1 hypothetical protein FOXG_19093 [Fusarium oxysporum f. sp. lycopersici 4287]